MSCCPPEAEPARAAAAHASATITVGQTSVYRAGPATAAVGILAFPDIFGMDSGRAKQDADRLGELGFAVAFVDLAAGDYACDGWDREAWRGRMDYDSVLLPRVRDAIQHLRGEAKVVKIASYGYCWGAWVGARVSAEDGPHVEGHVSFHPSWAAENALAGDGGIEKLAARVKAPQLLLSAGNEVDEVKGGGVVDKTLSAHENERVRALSRVVDFPDVKHGWVNRGDLSDTAVKESVDTAWQLARTFLEDVTTA